MSKIKVGDTVIVRSGKDRTKTGQVELIVGDRVVVNGVNKVKRHQKKNAVSPQGGIVEKSLPIHISKVMVIDPKTKKPSRMRYAVKEGQKERIYTKSGEKVSSKKQDK